MALFWIKLWTFLKSVPGSVYATLAALTAIAVLWLQRQQAQERERLAKQDAERAIDGKRNAESKLVAVAHKTKAEVSVQKANEISAERESIRNANVKDLEQLEDMSDEEISQAMLRDAEETAKRLKNK